ncbi:MAG: ABC transporter permease [Bacteroidales bacterium]|nr:ABC transporter permease [Bacteroidales bacterium]MBO7488504.1 ABC transporter permease [Bacteroidales bacterium]
MNVYQFIASGIKNKADSDGKISSMSTRIGLISVAVSIFVIIVALCVVRGFRSEIRFKTSGYMGDLALVVPGQTPMNDAFPFTDSISILDGMLSKGYVKHIQRVAYSSGLVREGEELLGSYFKGVDSLYDFSFFASCLDAGELPDYSSTLPSNDILISRRIADKMGYEVGSSVPAFFIKEKVNFRTFKVCGIYDAQLEELDNSMIVADIRHCQAVNGWDPDEVSTMEVVLDKRANIDLCYSELEEYVFSNLADDDPSVFLLSVKRIFSNLFDWLNLLDYNVVTILILMMAVAGFNMISTLLIILFENISSIGLLKALGMTSASVSKVFRNVALNIVGKGLLWGNIAALAVCLLQKWTHLVKLDPVSYFVSYVPIEIDIWLILLIDAISVAVIMLILMLTSAFIARVDPAKTLRME